jgi:hypothetical protein
MSESSYAPWILSANDNAIEFFLNQVIATRLRPNESYQYIFVVQLHDQIKVATCKCMFHESWGMCCHFNRNYSTDTFCKYWTKKYWKHKSIILRSLICN